jgi:hypothetical protein
VTERDSPPGASLPAVAGLGLVVLEGLLALVGVHPLALSAAVLILGPGLALQPQLPRELGVVGRWAAVPIVGCAAASILVTSASTLGIPVTGTALRLVLLVAAAAGVVAARRWAPAPPRPLRSGRAPMAVAAALVAIVCAGVALQSRVIGGNPVPGTDWGHYLLYPSQVARQHSLVIDNPYWMLGGRRFRDDPALGALYGSALVMSGARASALAHGIWLFAVLAIVSVFLFASALGGPVAGLMGAGLYAAIPMNETILGWHGLGNLYGLALLPLALVPMAWALWGRTDRRMAALLALALVALAAAHRLTFLVACLALAVAGALGLALLPRRRELVVFGLRTAVFAVPLALLVVVDLVRRSHNAGGVQSYRVYLPTKVDLGLTISDLTVPVALAGVLALLLLLRRARRDPALLSLYAIAAATLILAYGWIVHVPTVYYRMVYFVPLVLAPAIGVALVALPRLLRLERPPRLLPVGAVVAAVGLFAATAAVAYDRGPGVREFYLWASRASLNGIDEVSRNTGSRDAVVTDRCWSFLAPWLLQRPVLAGIDPADILPAWEARPAATARAILYGRPAVARRLARRNGVRYAILNPGCASDQTNSLRLPTIGAPVYESTRLVVLDLSPGARRAGGGGGPGSRTRSPRLLVPLRQARREAQPPPGRRPPR